MHIRQLLCIALPAMVLSAYADAIKGDVHLIDAPSIQELANCYEKSDKNDPYYVAYAEVMKKYSRSKEKAPSQTVSELRSVPDDKVLAKTGLDANGVFSLPFNPGDKDCRVVCRCEIDGKKYFGTVYIGRDEGQRAYGQTIVMRRADSGYVSVAGRCLSASGQPVTNALVMARLISAPLEVENEKEYYKTQYARSDKNGYWRVDGVEKLNFTDLLAYACDTNLFVSCGDGATHPPYGIEVVALMSSESEPFGSVAVPNITAEDFSAVKAILATYKQKTGKAWPKATAMVSPPCSTNNVIYVPDIVLKRR